MDNSLAIEQVLSLSFISSCESWEEYVSLGLTAREFKDKSQWYLGRLAMGVISKYGENTLGKYSKEIGIAVATIQKYRWVVAEYLKDDPTFLPSPKLPFTLYEAVATMPKDERAKFLQTADDNNFSIERTRVERKKLEGKPIKPSFSITLCPIHNKWFFDPRNPEEWEVKHG